MRRCRVKFDRPEKELDRFYKIITNAHTKGRGQEVLFLSPCMLNAICDKICERYKDHRCKVGLTTVAAILERVYRGERLSTILSERFIDSISRPAISRQTISRYLQWAVDELDVFLGTNKITVNTIYLSGWMYRIAWKYEIDLRMELRYYKIRYLSYNDYCLMRNKLKYLTHYISQKW